MLFRPQKDFQDKIALSRSAQTRFLYMLAENLLFLSELLRSLCHKNAVDLILALEFSFRHRNSFSKTVKFRARAVSSLHQVQAAFTQDQIHPNDVRGKIVFKRKQMSFECVNIETPKSSCQ